MPRRDRLNSATRGYAQPGAETGAVEVATAAAKEEREPGPEPEPEPEPALVLAPAAAEPAGIGGGGGEALPAAAAAAPGLPGGAASPDFRDFDHQLEKSSLLSAPAESDAVAPQTGAEGASGSASEAGLASDGGGAGTVLLSEAARTKLLLAVALNTLLVPTAITIIVPALRQISTELDATAFTSSLTLSLYSTISGIQPLFSGPLSDRYGRRNALLLSHLIWAVSCVLCATAPTIEVLVAARCLQAVGCSSFVVVGVAAIGDVYGDEANRARLPLAMARVQMCAVLGVLGAPTLGGALTELFGWRGIFWAMLLLGGEPPPPPTHTRPRTATSPHALRD